MKFLFNKYLSSGAQTEQLAQYFKNVQCMQLFELLNRKGRHEPKYKWNVWNLHKNMLHNIKSK